MIDRRPFMGSATTLIPMRDLTDDLRARLAALKSEAEAARNRLEILDDKIEATERMLELEEADRTITRPFKPKRLREIHEIVREQLLKGETNKDRIIAAVEKEGHEKPGRSVNASLMTSRDTSMSMLTAGSSP